MATPFSTMAWSQTAEAVADTTNMTNAKYLAVQGVASPFSWAVRQVSVEGEATASNAMIMQMARDSTVGATLVTTSSAVASLDPSSAAARILQFTGATTKPQRSATLKLLTCSFNAWGGIYLWNAPPGDELIGVGATASFGEMSLSGFTGCALAQFSCHFILEER